MTSLVTGATGFIGRHLVAQLASQGEPVRALYRDEQKRKLFLGHGEEAVRGDCCDPAVLSDAVDGADVVYHCAAAHSTSSASEIQRTNLPSVRCLLETVRNAGRRARVILMSSLNVLGNRGFAAGTEDLPRRRTGEPHVDLKIDAEELAERQIGNGADIFILRPGLVYGQGEPHLPKLARAIQRGKFIFIGSRDNIVPMIHVSDLVQAMWLAGKAPTGVSRIFNLTDGAANTIGRLVECLARAIECPVPTKVLPVFVPRLASTVFGLLGRDGPVSSSALRFLGTSREVDISRSRSQLNFAPRVAMDAAIDGLKNWLKQVVSTESAA